MNRYVAFVLWFALAGSVCGDEPVPQQPQPKPSVGQPATTAAQKAEAERNKADAEKAKVGLITVICGDKSPFVGKPDRAMLEKMPVINSDDDPSKFYWSVFEIDVKKHQYHGTVIAPKLRTAWTYSGTFTISNAGEWIPDKPKVIEARGNFDAPKSKTADDKTAPTGK
jgi:hypothetical protein